MPRGRKKKAAQARAVLPSLSDTDTAAPDSATSTAPAPAPATSTAPDPAPATSTAPDPDPDDAIISTTPTGLEGLTQEYPSSQPPPAKRLKKQLRQLSHEEEDDVAEWLKSHPCLYNKKLEEYRKTDMKQRLWEEKAADFPNFDVEYLLGWYKSVRTRFGKLTKLPSGAGAQDLTERDASILSKFAFLKTHITRQRGTQLGGVSIKNLLDLNNLFYISYPHVLLSYFHFV